MSFDQIHNFLEKLESSPQLIDEAQPMNVNDILLLARREGFEITLRDWRDFIQEKIRQASVQLSDAELENVAAGNDIPPLDLTIIPFCQGGR
jgi:predicted ribosomally synthesized peptide with nif11-like leader